MSTTYDVLIIGAGASGLMAMNELTNAGYSVCVLEATDKAGGRIMPIVQAGHETPPEAGAEFIHGTAPLTVELLNLAGIRAIPVTGKMITVRNGVWFDEEDGDEYSGSIVAQMEQVKEDITLKQFLDTYLPGGEHDAGRKMVQQMAQGFSLMDINKASLQAFYKDMLSLNEPQHRLEGGYGVLVNYLLKSSEHRNAVLHFGAPVTRIEHGAGLVTAYTADNRSFAAAQCIITASAGVLQQGGIYIDPLPTEYAQAIQQLGFGSVVKILFRFREAFWKERDADTGFLLSNETIPTWWTQSPTESALLTGWVGGPPAAVLNKLPGDELYELALASLAGIFQVSSNRLRNELVHHHILCWDEQPYVRGGYSYPTLQSAAAKEMLNRPINNTIYFAGEALHTGNAQGTVEAALVSGKEVAARIVAKGI